MKPFAFAPKDYFFIFKSRLKEMVQNFEFGFIVNTFFIVSLSNCYLIKLNVTPTKIK